MKGGEPRGIYRELRECNFFFNGYKQLVKNFALKLLFYGATNNLLLPSYVTL